MDVRYLYDSDGHVYSPKTSADSVYLSGSKTTLTTKLNSLDSGKYDKTGGNISGAFQVKNPDCSYGRVMIWGDGESGYIDIYNEDKGIDGNVMHLDMWNNQFRFVKYNGGSLAGIPLQIKDDGAYAIGFYVNSLRSLKRNINPTKVKAVDLINSQSIVDFTYKDDKENQPKIGLIADDSDPLFLDSKRETVDLYNTCGILMKAVQELSTKVKNLTEKLDFLTSKFGGGWNSLRKLILNLCKSPLSMEVAYGC